MILLLTNGDATDKAKSHSVASCVIRMIDLMGILTDLCVHGACEQTQTHKVRVVLWDFTVLGGGALFFYFCFCFK